MAKYLLLKHYRGAPAPANDVPMDQWSPDEVEAHIRFMNDFAARLEGSGEFIEGQALSPDGVWVRYDGEGRPAVTDGPFAETKDLIAGWMVIDVDSYERAIELAGELSAAPGAGGAPAGLAALAEVDEHVPRREAVAAYLHEKSGDLELAARLYADAARNAPNLAERDHQMRQAARLNQHLQHHR